MSIGLKQKQLYLLIAIVLVSLTVWTITQDVQDKEEEQTETFDITSKWSIQCKDLLNEGSDAGSGTLAIYDKNNPGVSLESGLSVSSGIFTTGQAYTSGQTVFLKYTDATYFDYGYEITFPSYGQTHDIKPSDTTPIASLSPSTILYVIKMADVPDSGYTDIDILKDGASEWDGSAAKVNGFNITDNNYQRFGIMVTNEDIETSYFDPRGYHDYSQATEDGVTWDVGAFVIVEFDPTGTTTSGVNLDPMGLVRFSASPAGMEQVDFGNNLVLFYPITSLEGGWVYDVIGSTTNPNGVRDGNDIIFEVTFDFSGSIQGDIGTDDIDIEVSFASSGCFSWYEKYNKLSMSTDDPFGEAGAGWTNDLSIGYVV